MTKGACLERPDRSEAIAILREALLRKWWTIVYGLCSVQYEGRGASTSTPGERLVIIKPSQSIIVHGPRNFKPENWQPDGSIIHVEASDRGIVLVAVRKKPREVLRIVFDSIEFITTTPAGSLGTFTMYLSENEIRDVLMMNPDLIEEGFRPVEKELPVESGFVDIFGLDRNGKPTIVEIKRVKAGESAVRQLYTYLLALEKKGVKARGILAAPSFSESAITEAKRRGVKTVYLDLARLRRLLQERSRRTGLDSYFKGLSD